MGKCEGNLNYCTFIDLTINSSLCHTITANHTYIYALVKDLPKRKKKQVQTLRKKRDFIP